ncbi:MAG: PrsW family intramembrane metalloprotease [Treponema sp.]|nr:PrsW family intramembrane metalloprotease [Treponema sp.]
MAYLGIVLCFIPLILMFIIDTFCFKLEALHQLFAILLGLFAVLPISFIQYFLPGIKFLEATPVLYSLLKSIILYGLVEEMVKMVLFLPLPHKDYTEFKTLMLAFIFGAAIASFESVVYFLTYLQNSQITGGKLLYGSIFLRIFSSDIIHICCTGLCALFVYTLRNKPARISILVTAILLHGIYDFFAGFTNGLRWFSVPVILLTIAECRIKYTSLQTENQ